MLCAAGFELRYVSMRSEACYYGLPGHVETIRIAAHARKKRDKRSPDNCIVKITVTNGVKMDGGGHYLVREKLHNMVAFAIGTYMLRIAGVAHGDASRLKPGASGSTPDARTSSARVAQ